MQDNLKQGIYYMLLASLSFAVAISFAKLLSESMSSIEVVFFRNIAGVIIIYFSIIKKPLQNIGGKPWLLFFRGFMGFVGLFLYFYNIANIPLAEAVTYVKAAPVFTAVIASIFLKEHLNIYSWIAVCLGFIGVVFVMQPNNFVFDKYDVIGLLCGLSAAIAYNAVRELRAYYDTRTIVLSFTLIGSIGPLILMLISHFYYTPSLDFILGEFVMPDLKMWMYILILGSFSTFPQIFMTKAYAQAKAGLVGTITYTTIIFSIIFGVFLGDSLPDFWKSFGIILIIFSGALIALRGHK